MDINIIEAEELTEKLFLASQPLVIKSLFLNHPISNIRTRQDAQMYLPDYPLRVIRDYIEIFKENHTLDQSVKKMTLTEFFQYIQHDSKTDLRVRDFSPPESFSEFMKEPDFCLENTFEPIIKTIFLAPKGAASRLHMDNDQNHVFLYQVFGKKRAILFPPTSSEKLLPVLNLSFWFLDQFNENERNLFIKFAEGLECILEPGDTLYIPKLYWHHLDYLDDAMSINFRFGRNIHNKFMAEHIHLDYLVQNFSVQLDENKPLFKKAQECLLKLQSLVANLNLGSEKKYELVSEMILDWINQHIPEIYNNKSLSFGSKFVKSNGALEMLSLQNYQPKENL